MDMYKANDDVDIIDLLYQLKLNGGSLSMLGEDIAISLRKGYTSIDPHIINKIKENKKNIINFIKENESKQIKSTTFFVSEKKEFYNPSSIQKRFYNLQKIDVQSTAYNVSSAFEISGKFNYLEFSDAINKVINQNDILKSFYIEHEENIYLKIHNVVKYQIETETLGVRNIQNIIEEFTKPIDLKEWPLYRFKLYSINENKIIFLCDFHHSIIDGFSLGLFIEQIVYYYQTGILKPVKLQFTDFLGLQSKKEYQDKIYKNNNYWKKIFSGELPVLDIPTDFLRPQVKDSYGKRTEFRFEQKGLSLLKKAMKQTETTLNMILITCYNIILHKYTEQEDIIVGMVTSGREHSDVKNLLGLLIETIPLRNFPEPDKSIGLFIQEVKRCVIDSYENQPFPFENIMKFPSNKKDISRNPIFDTMLIVQNLDNTEITIDGLEIKPISKDTVESKLDISIEVIPKDDELIFSVVYRTSLFTEKTIEKLFERLFIILRLFSNISNDSATLNIRIKDISIIDENEKNKILNTFNCKQYIYPEKNYIELFINSALQHIDRVALEDHAGCLTYGQIHEMSDSISHYLDSEYNIGQGDFVGLMITPCNEMVVIILSILKLGAVYVPLNIELPDVRVRDVAIDCSLKLIVVEKALEVKGNFIELSKEVLLENANKNLRKFKVELSSLTNPAYLIYTSGSTGRPKGVLISQLSLIDYVTTFVEYYHLDSNDIIIQQSSSAFDVSVEEIFPILLSGGKIFIMKHGARDIEEIVKVINVKHANILSTVPLVINELNKFSSSIVGLKALISGGDVLKMDYIDKLISNNAIYNTYGPTETTVCGTFNKVNSFTDEGCIGSPIRNRNVLILDKNNDLCPIGLRGEICIGGLGVAIGYLNQPDLTAKKFVSNSFNSDVIYKTGDYGSWHEDGTIKFLGRKDFQVKLRGVRIELGEIESILCKHEDVRECVVVSIEVNKDKQLCAYVVPNREIIEDELRSYMMGVVPDYMVPRYYVVLRKMPLTSNGKIDFRSLPEPEINVGLFHTAPTSLMEIKIVNIWADILKVEKDKICVNRNFFELGGHSLNAYLALQLINDEFNISLTLKELLINPTISSICRIIKTKNISKRSYIPIVEKKEYYLVSYTQRLMYMSQLLHEKSNAYNIPLIFEINGELDIERLINTFEILIRRHEILHTSFHVINNNIVQKTEKAQFIPFECIDLPEDKVLETIRKAIQPFDVKEYPLYRTLLLRIEQNRYVLFFDMHHIITDGVSFNIVMEDLMNIYKGNEIPPLKVQYKDYSEWHNKFMKSEEIIHQEDYWLNKYKSKIPDLSMHLDFQRPTVRDISKAKEIKFIIDEEQLPAIKKLVANNRSTLFSFLLTLYNILLHKCSGQCDIVIGSPVTGRSNIDLQKNIGVFINMLPIRNEIKQSESFLETFKNVTNNAIDAFSNQDYPLENLLIKLGIKGDTNRNPLFDNGFNFLNYNFNIVENSQLSIIPYKVDFTFSKYDLHYVGVESNNTILMTMRYSTELYKETTAKMLIDNFREILNQVIVNPEIEIQNIILKQNLAKVEPEVAVFESDFNF